MTKLDRYEIARIIVQDTAKEIEMNSLSTYDIIILQGYFAAKKEPTDREKAAAAKLDKTLLEMVESLVNFGPLPR